MTALRVAIVGHSQVPPELTGPNFTVHIFRRPGAKVNDWREVPEFVDLLKSKFDLVFLWLGSNDITSTCQPNAILRQINLFALQIENSCEARVVVVEVESRQYQRSRHFVPPNQYLRIRRAINIRLHLQKRYSLLSFGALKFELATDGVHFKAQSKLMIKQKFMTYIEKFRAGTLV